MINRGDRNCVVRDEVEATDFLTSFVGQDVRFTDEERWYDDYSAKNVGYGETTKE